MALAADNQPEPVKVAGQIQAAVTAVVGAAAALGILAAATADKVNASVAVLVSLVPPIVAAIGALWAAWHVRAKVTPVASPRDENGVRLVPATPEPPSSAMPFGKLP